MSKRLIIAPYVIVIIQSHYGCAEIPRLIRVINSREMRWTRHLSRMGKKTNAYKLLVRKRKGKIKIP
jgi:hypothetical protein